MHKVRLQLHSSFFFLVMFLLLTYACKKKEVVPALAPYNSILTFQFNSADNPGTLSSSLIGIIKGDSVRCQAQIGINLTKLVPTITISQNATIKPASGEPQNFTHPVNYTVTAQDGSTQTYAVTVSFLDSAKSITSFIFKAVDNPGVLLSDVAAAIGKDTITAIVPPGVSVKNLVPDITVTGVSVAPANKAAQNFSNAVTYTVYAQDNNIKLYTIIVSTTASVYFGSRDGYIYCLNAFNGNLKWKFKTNGACQQTPGIYKKMIIAISNDRYLYALDTATGTLQWKINLGEAITGTPQIANGIVYVAATDLFAIDAQNGSLIWQSAAGMYAFFTSPTVYKGVVYSSDYSYNCFAFNALTGAKIWGANMGLGGANCAATDSVIYTAGELEILSALNKNTGALIWSYFDRNAYGITNPSVSNGMVYVQSSTGLYAFDVITHAIVWQSTVLANGAPVVYDSMLYALDYSGLYKMAVVNCKTGKVEQNFALYPNRIDAVFKPNFAVANERLFMTDGDGYIYCTSRADGSPLWRFATDGSIDSPPLIIDSGGKVFYPGNSGEQN